MSHTDRHNTSTTDTWQFYRDARGHHRWRRTAPNGEIVGASTEGYASRQKAIANAIRNGYDNHTTPDHTTSQPAMTNTRAAYIDRIAPLAVAARQEYPALFPSLAIAQAILESGNGRSELARTYHNHFGIKANKAWKGKVVSLKTKEVYDSKEVTIVDGFRAYDSAAESFRDRNRFLARNRRYTANGVFSATTPQDQAKALQRAGYATDPAYAAKLIDLIAAHGLERYDAPEAKPEPPKPSVVVIDQPDLIDPDRMPDTILPVRPKPTPEPDFPTWNHEMPQIPAPPRKRSWLDRLIAWIAARR